MATKLLYNMMATFTLFLLQLDDSAQLLIGSYYDSSVTTKKKATSRSPRFQTSPGAAKLTIETSKGKRKRRRRHRDHQQKQEQQQHQLDSSENTAKTTTARDWFTQTKTMQEFSFWESCPIPVCPLNHVFIYWGCLQPTPFTRTARAALEDGRTDGRTAARPTTTSFFLS